MQLQKVTHLRRFFSSRRPLPSPKQNYGQDSTSKLHLILPSKKHLTLSSNFKPLPAFPTAGSIFLVELYLGFHMGFVGTHNMRKRVIMSGKAVSWFYIRHDTFIVDLISAAALVGQVGSQDPQCSSISLACHMQFYSILCTWDEPIPSAQFNINVLFGRSFLDKTCHFPMTSAVGARS